MGVPLAAQTGAGTMSTLLQPLKTGVGHRQPQMKRKPTLERLALAVIIALACSLSAIWAIRVPMLLSPDETAHMDYAFALYDAGAPFVVQDARPATTATTQVRYLITATGYRKLRYSSFSRVPPGYDSRAYRANIDANAPRPTRRPPPQGAAVPYVMFAYPFAYYALIAAVMVVVGDLNHDSITTVFYAARLANVVLLGATLLLSYLTFRAYRVSIRNSLLATFAIGTFPLVTWVSGYAQPDNLTFLVIVAVICCYARWRLTRFDISRLLSIAALLGFLFFTKQHYAVATYLATVPGVLVRLRSPRCDTETLTGISALIGFPILCAVGSTLISPVAHLSDAHGYAASFLVEGHSSPLGHALSLLHSFFHGLVDIFLSGTGFGGYWFRFGVRGSAIYDAQAISVLSPIIECLTVAVFAFLMVGVMRSARVLIGAFRGRSLRRALLIATGAVPALSYVFTTAIIIAIYATANGSFALQGRYWLPVELCLFIFLLVGLPRTVPAKRRRLATTIIAITLASYSLAASACAMSALQRQYYTADPRSMEASLADFESVRTGKTQTFQLDDSVKVTPGPITLTGYDVDSRNGLPGRSVRLTIDGRIDIEAQAGIDRPAIARTFHDDQLRTAGFVARIPAGILSTGRHFVRASIVNSQLGGALPFHRILELDVESAPRATSSSKSARTWSR